jgi:malate dehydrogenase (oxaloacetate-decarboxylating)(NADP+)
MQVSKEDVLEYHLGGKIGLKMTKEILGLEPLCKAYTPGVALPCKEIAANPDTVFKYTAKSNLVAVVSDGTAILGLGDLGPEASIPVMEGKAVLFKAFGDVDGWPVPLQNCRLGGREGKTDPSRVIDAVCAIAPMYGGINLEDIAAPACFEIEDKLEKLLDIPVFHDDQWGTAVITLAGVMNYCELSERKMADLKVVINGAGAAGIRICELLKDAGATDVVLCDSKGVISRSRDNLSGKKAEHAAETDCTTVSQAMKGANVFVGVSVADCISVDDVMSMDEYPAIFAMANPDPEIRPEAVAEGMKDRRYVMATGRSDYPNQINNVLGFPFLFRGALDVRSRYVNKEMKVAAAKALAAVARKDVPDYVKDLYGGETLEFSDRYIIPKPFDRRLFVEVSEAVARAAVESGVAPQRDMDEYHKELEKRNLDRFDSF